MSRSTTAMTKSKPRCHSRAARPEDRPVQGWEGRLYLGWRLRRQRRQRGGIHLWLLAILLLLALAPLARASDALLTRLQDRLRQLNSLCFDFHQRTGQGSRVRLGQGSAIFVRVPGSGRAILRWTYDQPTEQIIVNDGQTISLYLPKDHQLITTPVKGLENDLTYGLFAGQTQLSAMFKTVPVKEYDVPPLENTTVLRLVPVKANPQIQSVQIWLDDQLLIRRLILEDHFETITELDFDHIRVNSLDGRDPAVLRSVSHLEISPGTEILHQ